MASTKAISVLPAPTAVISLRLRIRSTKTVTVVLPFVPVIAAMGRLSHCAAKSSSLTIGIPTASANV